MADTKISAMTPAAELANADLVPAVQGAVNVKVTRAGLLTATPGEAITLVGASGSTITIDPIGDITLTVGAGFKLLLRCNGGSLAIDSAGVVGLAASPGHAVHVEYTPAFPGDWAGVPNDVWAALDRIARVVSLHGATPIP